MMTRNSNKEPRIHSTFSMRIDFPPTENTIPALQKCPRNEMDSGFLKLLFAAGLFFFVAFLPVHVFAANNPGARETVQTIVDETVSILKSKLPLHEKRSKISAIADSRFDFDTMGRLTLAKNWSRFSTSEQADFLRSFRTFLGDAYGTKFDQYQDETVQVLGERSETRGDITVQTTLLRNGGEKIAIDYRLRTHEANWRIIDVTIEGVSLVSSYRSQFQEILENGTPQELLRQIRDKNAQEKP